jgi:hypothetical protein
VDIFSVVVSVVVLVLSCGFAIGLIVVARGRLAGRHSRYDRLLETVFRSQEAGVYPESLRGERWRREVSDPEPTDGAQASGRTPSEQVATPAPTEEMPGR